jgi:hypothetical protein
MKKKNKEHPEFEINEVLKIKNFLFKVVLVDAFTGKIALKQISDKEAVMLKETGPETRIESEDRIKT